MLDEQTLPRLNAGKNLLAFSAGVDSTALFFLLREAGIAFDIAHVNYHTREQSEQEEARARDLAKQYGLTCHCHQAPQIQSNFEAQARAERYTFFEKLITEFGYDNLLTAHQLDDRFEWLLMQLGKGAGLPELLGMSVMEPRPGYSLVRPLLGTGKSDLMRWLDMQGHRYFEDASNADPRHRRNRIRETFSTPFLQEHLQGVQRSFSLLERDAEALKPKATHIHLDDHGVLLLKTPNNRLELMRTLDRWLKEQGYLLKGGEKERIMRENDLVLGRRYALGVRETFTLLTPYVQEPMPKPFKEECRRLGIGTKVRPFLFRQQAIFEALRRQLGQT